MITDYSCIFPDPIPPTPPASQIVYLSSKNVPVRYFDATGSSKAAISGDTLPQEGNAFSYRNGNLLDPTNVPALSNPVAGADNYIGFNEIYGSLSYTTNSAKPAKEVGVTKGKIYDIYVDNGSYSNCIQCGNDYYSQLNRLFPLAQLGGGTTPFQSRTDRTLANGISADDRSFGRACFVPASMIPWSHSTDSDTQTQRLKRLRAQHFMYANGYQHDWYGFDYGAVIGSFDGVRWFAIGTNRRIKADSNKLFLAVNGPFGDLALESTYNVTVNDGALNPVGSNMVTTDYDSDGAECQRFHQCTTDNDCATTLGWDYACANVNEITTSWPAFDDNAKEIPDTQRSDNQLVSILSLANTGKRCVYRGRGAACTPNYLSSVINLNSTFNQTQTQSFHGCSANNYCQAINSSTTLNPNFNNRISRYGKVRVDSSSDTFGLAAKVPGRPLEFNAQETVRSETVQNFSSNHLPALCIPGRDPEQLSFVLQNSTTPSSEYMGDKILNIGMTYKKNTAGLMNPRYLESCSIMDDNKNYFSLSTDPSSLNSTNSLLMFNSGAQAVSSNLLGIFSAIFSSKGMSFNLYKNNSTVLNSFTLTENRCMRAPAASCFSDNDCAPSKPVTDIMKLISSLDTTVTSIINSYEVKFWQEDLVCSQATSKSDPSYSPFNNRCCRDVGNTISLPSADSSNHLKVDKIPGIDISINDKYRYTRAAVLYKDTSTDSSTYPALKVGAAGDCPTSASASCVNITTLNNQFISFSTIAERMSCSGDWIRSFSNGDHVWGSARFQSFNPLMLRCMNWRPQTTSATQPPQWSCSGLDSGSPDCQMAQTSPYSSKAKGVLTFLAKLELMGIPQIGIEHGEYYNTTAEGIMSCLSNPNNQADQAYPGSTSAAAGATYTYPSQLYSASPGDPTYVDTSTGTPTRLYSAAVNTNFQNMKQVFKSDEVSSCYAAGTTMSIGASANLCCTGFINSATSKCQLPDFVDLSIYTNRYVSSEGKKLSLSLFDQNGYIKDPSYVANLACQKSMCASGKIAFGTLVASLKIPGQETLQTKAYRFLQGSPLSDDENGLLTLFTKGLKLNNHAYCLPAGANNAGANDLTIITCN